MARRPTSAPTSKPVELFVSYSHRDKFWFERLRPLLKFRACAKPARLWHDQELTAGCRWDQEIRTQLDCMDVFLCLVSHSFHDSDYIMDVELPRAQARHQAGEVEVVPILLEDVNLDRDLPFLKGLNHLPAFERPWNNYNPRANAHRQIRDGVFEAIAKARAR